MLNAIGAGQGLGVDRQPIVDAKRKRLGQGASERSESSQDPEEHQSHPEPQLRVAPGTAQDVEQGTASSDDWLASTIESAKQIQQLASRLAERQIEIESRQQALEQAEANWNNDRQRDQQELEKRWSQLQQQTTQVRIQQRHVMQLQADIVRQQQATRASIERFVIADAIDDQTTRELKQLQHELGPRFEYIMRRWEHLYQLLENQRVQLAASSGLDERVNWNR